MAGIERRRLRAAALARVLAAPASARGSGGGGGGSGWRLGSGAGAGSGSGSGSGSGWRRLVGGQRRTAAADPPDDLDPEVVVTVQLDATKQSEATVGEPVTVQLPAAARVDGKITQVSPVAQSSSSERQRQWGRRGIGSGSGSTAAPSATIPVTITLNGRARGAGLDQAAVSVNFVQQRQATCCRCPVTALLATGGAGTRSRQAGPPHTLIPVHARAVRRRLRAGLRLRDLLGPAGHRLTGMTTLPGTDDARRAPREVVKEYPGGVHALRGVSVEIAGGDQVAVSGPSGSGKTTMLTILGTLERPSSGAVRVAGHDVGEASDASSRGCARTRSGFVFQGFHLQDSAHRARQRRQRDAVHRNAGPRAPGGRAGGARARRARPPPDAPPAPALRRRAPAGRDRSGDRQAPGGDPRRRADRQPRLQVRRRRCWRCCTSSAPRAPRSSLITHEEQIAASFPAPDPHARRRDRRGRAAMSVDRARHGRRRRGRRASRERRRLPAHELLRIALQGLRTRRLRAALSALGIAIGIGAMVAVVGVSASSQANLLATIDSLGTNLLTVAPGQTFLGSTRCFPNTAVPMIRHMADVQSAAAVYQVSERDRAAHAVRPVGADRRDRRRRGRRRICPGRSAQAGVGPLPERRQRELPDGRARRAGGEHLQIRARRATSRSYIGGTWFTVIGDHEAGAARPDLDTTVFIGLPVAERLFRTQPNPSEIYVRANVDHVTAVATCSRRPPIRRTPTESMSAARPMCSRRAPRRRDNSRPCCSGSVRSRCWSARSGSRTSW